MWRIEFRFTRGYHSAMPRSTWTGSISFGLVNVPVRAFSAVRDHDVHFHQLDKKSGSRIRYRKVAEDTGKEVDSDDIVLGFEVRSGRYVTFDDKELEALRPESTKTIEVTDFVALDEIDPIYYERTYWLAPKATPPSRRTASWLRRWRINSRSGSGQW